MKAGAGLPMAAGADGYIIKPFSVRQVPYSIDRGLTTAPVV